MTDARGRGIDGLGQAGGQQVAHLGARPRLGDEEVVGGGDGAQAGGEVADEGLDIGGHAGGLAGHRLDDREKVLGAVGELAHDEAHLLLVALALGEIDRGADDTGHAAVAVDLRLEPDLEVAHRAAERELEGEGLPGVVLEHAGLGRDQATQFGGGEDILVGAVEEVVLVGAGRGIVHEGVAQVAVLLEHRDRRVLEREHEPVVGGRGLPGHRREADVEEALLGDVERGAQHAVDAALRIARGCDEEVVVAKPPGCGSDGNRAARRLAGLDDLAGKIGGLLGGGRAGLVGASGRGGDCAPR